MHCPILFCVLLVFVGCKGISKCLDNPLNSIAEANTLFTANAYKELVQSQDGSFIFSGLSAEIILSLLVDGADGATRDELLGALNLPNNQEIRDAAFKQLIEDINIDSENLKLLSANKIYIANGFPIKKTFNKTAVDVYRSEVQNLDYTDAQAAANIINEWVAKRTNDKIQNLVDPSSLSAATVLVLVNALYLRKNVVLISSGIGFAPFAQLRPSVALRGVNFELKAQTQLSILVNGKWLHSFESTNTEDREFFTSETESKKISTMYTETDAKYLKSSELQAQFLELDLQDSNVSITFVLPDNKTGLGEVENFLESYLEPQLLETLRVGITLPKFSTSTQIDFVPVLQESGVTTVFSDQADLTKISSEGQLKVSFVVQKAFINITETGVEAAAATAGGISLTSIILNPPETVTFNANHPFIYYIREKTSQIILFVGRYLGDN